MLVIIVSSLDRSMNLHPLPSHSSTHMTSRHPHKRTNTDDAGASSSSSGACHCSKQVLVDALHQIADEDLDLFLEWL